MLQKIIDFIARIFGIVRKPKAKKNLTDDIYPMW
jgi:hypothetical protein